MTFNEYQKKSRKTAVYPKSKYCDGIFYPTLGLVGEAGEVAEKVKKVLRDDNGIITKEKKEELKKELGDVLWYIAQIATDLKLSLEDIASDNLTKLASRHKRGKIKGSGDNR
ncbi:MAG: nucleoside triphosphate pyrophosphohydrolase family protein [bacterium]|nr:nucleoside triphosphate pyrophosphohydrolase family protein [bacterium]